MNGERGHRVLLVAPASLPEGQDFAFLECVGEVWFALRRDRLTEQVLEDAWATYRAMTPASAA